MSQLIMQRNEKRNRRKALVITTFFYLTIIGGIIAYGSDVDLLQYLPDQVQEWLPASEEAAPNPDRA